MHRTAKELNLPAGDAVIRDGRVMVLPAGHTLDVDRSREIQPYQVQQMMAQTSTSQVILKTTYTDRANGYRRATAPLSVAFMVAGALVAIFVQSAPVFSLATIAWMFSGFCAAWLIGWLVHTLASPDGAVIAQAFYAYRIIRREQDYRHRGGNR